MSNKWISFLKNYSYNNHISYAESMADEEAIQLYHKIYKNKNVISQPLYVNTVPTKKSYSGNGVIEASNYLVGNYGYTNSMIKVVEKYKNKRIVSGIIMKTPVQEVFKTILSNVSSNFKKEFEKTPYDKLYHLFVVFTLEDGTKILIEKNEVINIVPNAKPNSFANASVLNIFNVPSNLTIGQMLYTTEQAVGNKVFFHYNASNNNCQNFILNLLKYNGMNTSQSENFIKQNTQALFDKELSKFSLALTNIGAFGKMLIT